MSSPTDHGTDALVVERTEGRPALAHVRPGPDTTAWLVEHREAVHRAVADHGALLLRGCGSLEPAAFAAMARVLLGEPMAEREGFAPRDRFPGGVRSSSKWPADQPMCMHNELSYALRFPRFMLFGCRSAPEAGGATALADTARVLAELPPELVERSSKVGWELRRTYRDEAGVTLADAFGDGGREEAEAYCRAHDIAFSWAGDGELRTRQRRPAVVRHPADGRQCWFNQIAFLNRLTLDPDVRDYLLAVYGPDGLPFDTRWGDSERIDADVVEAIHLAYEKATVREPWQAGDLLLVDNIRVAHSREPLRGPREVLVAMGVPTSLAEVADNP
jgi:alpha-ketoglutarate-dependent taurine dioxygenase